jgi:hypothetical protein
VIAATAAQARLALPAAAVSPGTRRKPFGPAARTIDRSDECRNSASRRVRRQSRAPRLRAQPNRNAPVHPARRSIDGIDARGMSKRNAGDSRSRRPRFSAFRAFPASPERSAQDRRLDPGRSQCPATASRPRLARWDRSWSGWAKLARAERTRAALPRRHVAVRASSWPTVSFTTRVGSIHIPP